MEKYREMRDKVRQVCGTQLWDEDWFIRGITKSGRKIGTKEDREGKIHLESNAWAVLSGAATVEQRIRYITLPLLHNVICTCVVLAVTGALKAFDLPWVMFPKGMPLNSTWLTSTYMYYHACETRNTDYGCAIAVLIVILGIVSSKVVNAIFKEKDY